MTHARRWTRPRPLGALLAATLATCALARYGLGAAGLIGAFVCAVLVLLSVIDIESHRLPNRILLPSTALVLAARLISAPEHWAAWLGAGLAAFACFLALATLIPAALGMGDVKLVLFLGFALGSAVLTALCIGILAGGIAATALLTLSGPKARRRAIPYGPYLATGAISTLLLLTP